MQKEMYDGRARDHYKLELSAKTEVIIVSIKFSSGFNQFSKKEVVLPGGLSLHQGSSPSE